MRAARLTLRALAVVVAVASNVLAQVMSALTDNYGPRPSGVGWAIVFIVVGLDYAVCALIAWKIVRSPLPGWLMVGASIFWAAGAWYPLTRDYGWLWPLLSGVTDLWAVFVGVLVLSYPSGRLTARFDRVLVYAVLGAFLVRFAGILLFSSPTAAECGCVANAYAVLPSDGADFWLGVAWRAVGLALLLTVAVRLTMRWFTSTLPARRVAFVMPLALLIWCYGTIQDSLSFTLGWDSGWLQFIPPIAIALIPPAFVGGVIYARGLRSRVADLVIVARDKVDRALWESSLARTLHDSSLRVFWWDEQLRGYETSDGDRMPEGAPVDRPGRSTLAIDSDQGPIALIEHDVALTQDDRLLDAVSSALLLSVDNDRLRHRLERTLQEVRDSRLRIVEEGYLARRRLERDLHDGSQQQLVSLAIGLRIATTKAQAAGNDEVAADLERASAQLADALRELRELARGIHPTVLTDGDLRSAIDELAQRSHLPVEVNVDIPETAERGRRGDHLLLRGGVPGERGQALARPQLRRHRHTHRRHRVGRRQGRRTGRGPGRGRGRPGGRAGPCRGGRRLRRGAVRGGLGTIIELTIPVGVTVS